ncbi:glutaminase [Arthrobacter sp. LAPM80]|uniref:glutaminase n=1 Tax=Arthrobacter sp. LAPM80 TaxID=3141788 RepID=UPI00398A63A1
MAEVDGELHVAGDADEVYSIQKASNKRNRAITGLLESYGRIKRAPVEVVDVYTKQCSLPVSARVLAIMRATLADGGVNPITGIRVVSADILITIAPGKAGIGALNPPETASAGSGLPLPRPGPEHLCLPGIYPNRLGRRRSQGPSRT